MATNGHSTLQKLVSNDVSTLENPQSSTISFHSINYTIGTQKSSYSLPFMKMQHKQILYDINGVFKSGMNAILGPTGSGKSSLLDILADRKDRNGLEGEVLLDGQPQMPEYKYCVGYVVQDNILSETLTVRENIRFSANLRLSKTISRKTKATIVEHVIEQLGLEGCADSRVGTESVRGISGGERKRTSIGMELVLSPSVLFLDEPTTGLDSSTAHAVLESLHRLSRRGHTIIFSIHQPRYSIFKLFDTIFLVAAGRCVYHGPANSVLPYFSSIGYECEQHDNPADFLLDVTHADTSKNKVNNHELNKKNEENAHRLHDLYIASNVYTLMQQEIKAARNRIVTTATSAVNYHQPSTKSRFSEILYVAQRTLRNVYRNPALITMQTFVPTFLAVLIGLIYLKVDNSESVGVPNRMGAIFFIVVNQVMSNLSAIELFIKERALFIHENASGYYHVSTYFIAKLICDLIPLRIIPSIIFSTIVYFMIGFQSSVAKFFIFYLAIFLTTTCGASICFLSSASVKVFGVANLLAAMSFVLMMIFGGFLVVVSSVGKYLSWIKWVSLFRYAINIITINEFEGLEICPRNNPNNCTMSGTYVINNDAHIQYNNDWDLWYNFVALTYENWFNKTQSGNVGAALFIIGYIGFYGFVIISFFVQQLKETQKQRADLPAYVLKTLWDIPNKNKLYEELADVERLKRIFHGYFSDHESHTETTNEELQTIVDKHYYTDTIPSLSRRTNDVQEQASQSMTPTQTISTKTSIDSSKQDDYDTHFFSVSVV
ncbi:unnamed protein product [Rotaria magnacalcarata]|uniref:ABC transporter domain-containing protein n=1 Tax=Rotaria magnacalcarata TaxID=392030 RepID=A0A815P1D3_9BILA|nr:unnamed protein product [Rotaria magnacalcarata]